MDVHKLCEPGIFAARKAPKLTKLQVHQCNTSGGNYLGLN